MKINLKLLTLWLLIIVTNVTTAATVKQIIGIPSSTSNAIVRWRGTGGWQITNSTVIIDDSGNITGVNSLETSDLNIGNLNITNSIPPEALAPTNNANDYDFLIFQGRTNKWSRDGAALTNLPGVNNIKSFQSTAGSGNWAVDTAAVQAALNASRLVNGYPVYIPAGDYSISNIILNAANTWNSDTGHRVGFRFLGDYGRTRLHQVVTSSPIMTITNALNNIILENLNFQGLGKAVSAEPLLVISGRTGSTDGFKALNCFFEFAWTAFDARAFSDSHFDHCIITANNTAGVFRGDAGEACNNVYFLGGSITGNNQGLNAQSAQLSLDHVELGAMQTNIVLCTSGNIGLNVIGCNMELGAGALVTVSNSAGVHLTISGGSRFVPMGGAFDPHLVDFQDDATVSSTVTITGLKEAALTIRVGESVPTRNDVSVINLCGLPVIVEHTGRYTNYASGFRLGEGGFGDNAPNTVYPNKRFNTITAIRTAVAYQADDVGYSFHFLGVRSNATYYSADIAEFWKERYCTRNQVRVGVANLFGDYTLTSYFNNVLRSPAGAIQWRTDTYGPSTITGGYIPGSISWSPESGLGYFVFAFQIRSNGCTVTYSNIYCGGALFPTNGIVVPSTGTISGNGDGITNVSLRAIVTGDATPVAVTIGVSPYTFINTTPDSLECYFSGAVAYAVAKQGAAVYGSLAGNAYFILPPTNTCTITYATVPTMFTNKFLGR